MPVEQRRLEIGDTPVGERDCHLCHEALANQTAYPSKPYGSSETLCGRCALKANYFRYVHRCERFSHTPLPEEEWQAEAWNGGLPKTHVCETCGHEYGRLNPPRRANDRYCCYECQSEGRNAPRRVKPVERPCIVCGNAFTPKRRDAPTSLRLSSGSPTPPTRPSGTSTTPSET